MGARARPSAALALGYQLKHTKLDHAQRAIDQAATAR
jgi:hypothetical protein